MDKYQVYVPKLVSGRETIVSGHRACQGCAEVLAVRYVLKALGRNTVIANATGCMEIISSAFPNTAWAVPWIHVAFENAAAVASGVEAGLKVLMRKGRIPKKYIKVVGMGGDGGTSDIGLQSLSGALERGHDMIYCCFDNEAYMNTGIQCSGCTPLYAWTNTTPGGKNQEWKQVGKKPIMEMLISNGIAYGATVSIAYPEDLVAKVKKAKTIRGTKFIHALSSCPPGWKIPSAKSVEVARLATQTGVFPLYEYENGEHVLSKDVKTKPVEEYLMSQGRFKHLTPAMVAEVQRRVDEDYAALKAKCKGAGASG